MEMSPENVVKATLSCGCCGVETELYVPIDEEPPTYYCRACGVGMGNLMMDEDADSCIVVSFLDASEQARQLVIKDSNAALSEKLDEYTEATGVEFRHAMMFGAGSNTSVDAFEHDDDEGDVVQYALTKTKAGDVIREGADKDFRITRDLMDEDDLQDFVDGVRASVDRYKEGLAEAAAEAEVAAAEAEAANEAEAEANFNDLDAQA